MSERQPVSHYSSPAAQRNREPIANVLRDVLPDTGKVLEIASGSGEHALYFAQVFPQILWQPSDHDDAAVASIESWAAQSDLPNLLAPVKIDAARTDTWPEFDGVSAILCINMVHISPWSATEGLMRGAAARLGPYEPLILYGPYLRDGVATAPSNLAFDADLKRRNPQWGVRSLGAVESLAAECGFARDRIVEMPSNNLTVIFRKKADL